ncbi:MAG TPA: AtpZ/AtpI family protein [Candidatus Dormibacteraeota bacterium]|nr:AtpZ/AtpI family protein [Candidatus Dormibacteraeota bacterium]
MKNNLEMADDPNDSSKLTQAQKDTRDMTMKSALAMELPFTLVGAVVVGGLVGYLLDKWLHTAPWMMVILGSLGFAGGVSEVVRRLRPR